MREIKFRAWEDFNKRWITEGNIGFGGACYRDVYSNRADELGTGFELVVCQYTGLHDKNGKEIYEGDIVELDGCIDGDMAEVMWLHPVAGFVFATKDGKDWWCPNSDAVSRSYEVIGNIYENPELLEKPNERPEL